MRNLLIPKIVDRWSSMVATTFRPMRDAVCQRFRVSGLFDFGSHHRVLEQIQRILSVSVTPLGL